ncbi:somatomedin-B and thrombospondin type-1 domain-containing protein-like [Centruroides vittatus]|uniref:somatomedin-B and thrombospondin type-1 domain-containing protein-like n=1 Tax=Centruroides vittatus TaxID=120091 RepID=UPI00350F10E9
MSAKLVLYLLFSVLLVQCGRIECFCRELKRCCSGRDSSCVVVTATENYVLTSSNYKMCYCDHACLKVGDCCPDFKETCLVNDCEVSNWGHWTECSNQCGVGVMARTRNILQQTKNGGQPCPELQQSRGCIGNNCERKSSGKVFKETALILSAKFSFMRSLNNTQDIRHNLRLKYPSDPVENSKEYCIIFEILKLKKGCSNQDDTFKSLTKGSKVCVSCERAAMRKHLGYRCNGDGFDGKSSRWISLANPRCQGRWIRRERQDGCPCDNNETPHFILV